MSLPLVLVPIILFLGFCIGASGRRRRIEAETEEIHQRNLEVLRLEVAEVRRNLGLVREPIEREKMNLKEFLERNR